MAEKDGIGLASITRSRMIKQRGKPRRSLALSQEEKPWDAALINAGFRTEGTGDQFAICPPCAVTLYPVCVLVEQWDE